MTEMIERASSAMREKRRELINQPLDRIWSELARAAIEAMRDCLRQELGNDEMVLAEEVVDFIDEALR